MSNSEKKNSNSEKGNEVKYSPDKNGIGLFNKNLRII